MTDIFEKVKAEVKIADVVEAFGIKLNSRNKGLCPFHHEKTASFSVDRKNNIFTCFGCGETGDAITFVSKLKEVEPLEAAKILAEMYRIDIDNCSKRQSIKDYLKACIRDVGKTDYFKKRGLNEETIKKCCLGYDEKRKAVVLPYSSELRYYQTRSIVDKKFYKPTTEEAGAEPLFNRNALWASEKEPVFVVESPICALSIIQCGANAVSLCGVGGTSKLVKDCKMKKPKTPLVLCLDNDDAGKKATESLAKELDEARVAYVTYNIAKDCKDPNELLMKAPLDLLGEIREAKKEVRKKYKRGVSSISAADLSEADIKEPDWLIPRILPQGLTILCASSKVGKSWMAMQLCTAISSGRKFMGFETNQHGCLYLALEDGLFRLKDRLKKVLNGEKPTSNFYLSIKADGLSGSLTKQLDEELEDHPGIKLVIIDTLQKIRGTAAKTESAYATDYRELGALKEYADARGICIFLIHHLRKMADENDVFNMISGSSGIMGVSDTILIIYKKKRDDENAQLFLTGREVKQQNFTIHFDDQKFLWEIIGTTEEQEKQRKQREFEENPITITAKAITKDAPYTWRGTATDLMKAIYDITGKACPFTPTELGKQIANLESDLYAAGVDHSEKKSGSKRVHLFTKRKAYQRVHQGYLFDDDDDDGE